MLTILLRLLTLIKMQFTTGDANYTGQSNSTTVNNRAKGRASDNNTGTSVRSSQSADTLGNGNATVQDNSTTVNNSRRTPRH